MRITYSVLSSCKRLVSAVYGVSKKDVRIQPLNKPSLGAEGDLQSLEVRVGEDACFITNSGEDRQVLGEYALKACKLLR